MCDRERTRELTHSLIKEYIAHNVPEKTWSMASRKRARWPLLLRECTNASLIETSENSRASTYERASTASTLHRCAFLFSVYYYTRFVFGILFIIIIKQKIVLRARARLLARSRAPAISSLCWTEKSRKYVCARAYTSWRADQMTNGWRARARAHTRREAEMQNLSERSVSVCGIATVAAAAVVCYSCIQKW